MKILHIFDDYGTPGERALAGEGSVPTVVYYLSPGYVPVALRQVLRRHSLDEKAFIFGEDVYKVYCKQVREDGKDRFKDSGKGGKQICFREYEG